jgi:hypothetical protein
MFYLIALSLLVGCAAPKERIVTNEVIVQVPCKITPPEKPVLPLTDNGSVEDNIFDKTKKALSEIELHKGYELLLEAAISGCN